MADYDFFVADVDAFCARLDALRVLRGNAVVDGLAGGGPRRPHGRGRRDLLVAHYDPIYLESMRRNFAGVGAPGQRPRWDGERRLAGEASGSRRALARVAPP